MDKDHAVLLAEAERMAGIVRNRDLDPYSSYFAELWAETLAQPPVECQVCDGSGLVYVSECPCGVDCCGWVPEPCPRCRVVLD